jgi:hypothetical protein
MKKYILLIFSILLLSSCWTDSLEPAFHDPSFYLRPGEDPGQGLYTNYQTLSSSNNSFITVQGTILATINDPDGDDHERGWMTYPTAYNAGCLDIHQVVISADAEFVYFYVCLQDRIYNTVSAAQNSPGFRWLLMGAWFGTNSASPVGLNSKGAGTNLAFYAPADTSHRDRLENMSTFLTTPDVQICYGLGVSGSATPIFGSIWDQALAVTTGGAGYVGRITMNSNDFLYNDGYTFPNISTVFAFKVYRASILPAGDWKVTLLTFGWEDYGLSDCYPGNNGYLRDISGYSSAYTPGVGGSAHIAASKKVMDLLAPTEAAQSNIIVSGQIAASNWISITLP